MDEYSYPVNIYGDVFSKVYNLYWTKYIDEITPGLVKFIKQRNYSSILDLCCGTGRLSKKLLEAGFFVIGLDLSINMINETRRKTKGSDEDFFVDDARTYTVNNKVDLVVSTFDSLNHFKDLDELKEVFQSVYRSIKIGMFIFDMNTARGLRAWDFVDVEDNEEATYIFYGKYVPEEKRAYSRVTGFLKEGDHYKKFNEVMINTVFVLEEVKALLRDVGFVNICFVKPDDLNKMLLDPEKIDRIMVLAEKK